MTAPAMPSPARIVGKSISHLERRGYTRVQARRIICEVVESIGEQKADFAPWAVDWLRGIYVAARGDQAARLLAAESTGGNDHE